MLRVRWLGRVRYADAHALQRALFHRTTDDYLLLLEHPHVYTLGVRGSLDNVLVDPASVGAELVRTDRGGDVTYHGPGQLVGYPILSVPDGPGSHPAYVHSLEQLVIDACCELGLTSVGRLDGYPGVWADADSPDARKVCAVGVRRSRGRTMHGFALNVDADLGFFHHIVPCGIADGAVTSLAAEGVDASMAEVVEVVVSLAAERWGGGRVDRSDVTSRSARAAVAPTARTVPTTPVPTPAPAATPIEITRKPAWLRAKADLGPAYRQLRKTLHGLSLVTVCEEAGCPNIFECWSDGTATMMINGDRCTRACGFCLVDTRKPLELDPAEPDRVAEAVECMQLSHAVITAVARDDLADGGAGALAATINAIRRRCPDTAVEVLVPDCKGDPVALGTIFAARPDVLNHNLETVARLQRTVRSKATYARSLAVLARAKSAGLTTKSGVMVGLGETDAEVRSALVDLRNVGVDIVTIGQYLQPSARHLPVARWWRPEEFEALSATGRALGFAHVQASPLTRSSYHARQAASASASTATQPAAVDG